MSWTRDVFIDVLGLKKPSPAEIHEENDIRMRSQYFDLVEHFPDKVDQLLDAINRVWYHIVFIAKSVEMICFF